METAECLALNLAMVRSLEDQARDPHQKFMTIAKEVETKPNGGALYVPQLGRTIGNCCFFISIADGLGDRNLAPEILTSSGFVDYGRCVDTFNPKHEIIVQKVSSQTNSIILVYSGRCVGSKRWIVNPNHLAILSPPKIDLDGAFPRIIRIVTNNAHFECITTSGEEFTYDPIPEDLEVVYKTQRKALAKKAKREAPLEEMKRVKLPLTIIRRPSRNLNYSRSPWATARK